MFFTLVFCAICTTWANFWVAENQPKLRMKFDMDYLCSLKRCSKFLAPISEVLSQISWHVSTSLTFKPHLSVLRVEMVFSLKMTRSFQLLLCRENFPEGFRFKSLPAKTSWKSEAFGESGSDYLKSSTVLKYLAPINLHNWWCLMLVHTSNEDQFVEKRFYHQNFVRSWGFLIQVTKLISKKL